MIVISFIVTSIFNPEYIKNNPLYNRFGYNNFCVYFDSAPANYIVMPLLVTYSALMLNYVTTDTQRAMLSRAKLTNQQYYFTIATNCMYGVGSLCAPLWLLVPPSVNANFHTGLFQMIMMFKVLIVMANYNESSPKDKTVKVTFVVWSFAFICACLISISSINESYYDTQMGGIQRPVIPHQIQQTLDYCYFIYLIFLNIFIPPGPYIKAHLSLVYRVEEVERFSDNKSGEIRVHSVASVIPEDEDDCAEKAV
jgi:hypothetical protein